MPGVRSSRLDGSGPWAEVTATTDSRSVPDTESLPYAAPMPTSCGS